MRPTRGVRPTCFSSAFFLLTFHQDINLDSRCCKNSWKNSHDFSGCQFHVPFRISTVRALAPSSSPRDGLLNDLLLRGLRSVPVVASMLTVADLGSVPVPPDDPSQAQWELCAHCCFLFPASPGSPWWRTAAAAFPLVCGVSLKAMRSCPGGRRGRLRKPKRGSGSKHAGAHSSLLMVDLGSSSRPADTTTGDVLLQRKSK